MNHVDTTKTITHVSLCAGYGGIDIGLKRAIPDLLTVAFSEIEAFACANLVAKMEAGFLDAAPIWSNLKTFPWEEFRGKVDILSGGYPCQPFSSAGKRLGTEDPRHLWPYIAKGIAIMQPRVCFFENVEGHITLGLRAVIEDLDRLGYEAAWGIFSAAEAGAPHQRKRVFIMAYCNGKRGQLSHWRGLAAKQVLVCHGAARRDVWPSRPGEPQHKWEPPRVVANARHNECGGRDSMADSGTVNEGQESASQSCCGGGTDQAGKREELQSCDGNGKTTLENAEQRQAQPPLGGDLNGIAGGLDYAELCVTNDNRTDELRLLGNGVVPATAEIAFNTLIKKLTA